MNTIIPNALRFGLELNDLADRATHVDQQKLSLSGGASFWLCFSARGCVGKLLSKRDKHNCKVKSHGKSWCDVRDGKCFNI